MRVPRIGWVALLAALVAGSSVRECRGQSREARFRVDVDLVRVVATVRDSNGAIVAGLGRDDFEIFDEGVPQEIAFFERESSAPLSLVLLIDVSASVAIKWKQEAESAAELLRALLVEGRGTDTVALYSFSHDVVVEVPFTRDLKRVLARLRSLGRGAGTSLYDALYFASRALEEREGRHALVLVSDGADTTSAKTFHEALRAVHQADAVVYPVLVVPVESEAGRHVAGENTMALLAQSTGGRLFQASAGPGLQTAFRSILEELRSQYLLGYYARGVPGEPGQFHRVEIRVKRPGLQVFARSGYYKK